jgi:hypothetical protein
MKLLDAVSRYVTHKQSMGIRFNSERRILKSFCCSQQGKDLAQIEPGPVLQFIAGNGPPTRFWHRKHETLTGVSDFLCLSHTLNQEAEYGDQERDFG